MPPKEPQEVLLQARGKASPLYEPENSCSHAELGSFTRYVGLNDYRLSLPADLAAALRSWSLSRPPESFASRRDLRKHAEQGLATAQVLAAHLGPSWAVRYWDEHQKTDKWVCWGCDRLHWQRDRRETPPHQVHLTLEGEFQYGPLRSDGFGDFFPDDPAAGLHLSDRLVTDLYAWAKSIDSTLNRDVHDRVDGAYDDDWQRLFLEGTKLAERLAHEVGPTRTVTYKGLAHGGLGMLTSITWQGDRQFHGGT
ncbi:hypothetical protein [Streptomyces sp. NPDC127084]|uniref:hypothetical protein n=1 Tax=Streptomyces sp. NPDC127084 TaxID=3347133 RepID=UPI00366A1F24